MQGVFTMTKMSLSKAGFLLVCLTSPAAVLAQPAEQPAPMTAVAPSPQADSSGADPATTADPARCELHVWGAERFQSVTTGWLSGFGLVGGIVDSAAHQNRDRLNRSQLGEALNTGGQAAALASLDLPQTLGLPDYHVVTHEEPMDPEQAERHRGRHAASPSRCYAELMVTRVFYQKAAIYGRSLRTSFLFRHFSADQAPQFVYAGRGGNGLSVFPAREDAQVDAANEEIVRVFKANFQEYANNLNRRRARPRRS